MEVYTLYIFSAAIWLQSMLQRASSQSNPMCLAFGVLLLEIISGKRTSKFNGYGDFINLLGHVRPFILRHPNKYR
jgi:hypothetical protein